MQRRVSVQKEAFSPLPFVLPLPALKIEGRHGPDTGAHTCPLRAERRPGVYTGGWSLGHSGDPPLLAAVSSSLVGCEIKEIKITAF